MISGRECIKVEYEEDGKTTRVWIWEYKGLPLKYEVYDGTERIKRVEFENLAYNGVKDSDVVH